MKQLKYRLIVFDFDGTICDTSQSIIYCINRTFERFGQKLPNQNEIVHLIATGAAASDIFRQFLPYYLKVDAAVLNQWVSEYRDIYHHEGVSKIQVYPGVRGILSFLHDRGIIVIVMSNKGELMIKSVLKNLGLQITVNLAIGDRYGVGKKPHPNIFNRMIKPKFPGISKQEILMVGDTEADIVFAQAVGIDVCWASYGYGNVEACVNLSPNFVVNSIDELIEILRSS